MLRRNFLQLLGLGAAAAPAAPAAIASLTAPSVTSTVVSGLAANAGEAIVSDAVEAVAGEKAAEAAKTVSRLRKALARVGDADYMVREWAEKNDHVCTRDRIDAEIDCLKSVSLTYKRRMQMKREIELEMRARRVRINQSLVSVLLTGEDNDVSPHYY